jgi:hypothetical protein
VCVCVCAVGGAQVDTTHVDEAPYTHSQTTSRGMQTRHIVHSFHTTSRRTFEVALATSLKKGSLPRLFSFLSVRHKYFSVEKHRSHSHVFASTFLAGWFHQTKGVDQTKGVLTLFLFLSLSRSLLCTYNPPVLPLASTGLTGLLFHFLCSCLFGDLFVVRNGHRDCVGSCALATVRFHSLHVGNQLDR